MHIGFMSDLSVAALLLGSVSSSSFFLPVLVSLLWLEPVDVVFQKDYFSVVDWMRGLLSLEEQGTREGEVCLQQTK